MKLLLTLAAATLLSTPVLAQDNAAFTGPRVAAYGEIADTTRNDEVTYGLVAGIDAPLGANWTVGADVDVKDAFDNEEFGVGARLGYAVTDYALVFGRVGYTSFEDAGNLSRDGLVVGGGVEWAIGERTHLNTEYRYNDQDGAHAALIGIGFRF